MATRGHNLKARPGAGRPHGAKGKIGLEAKEALRLAFEGMGGVARLTKWADINPGDFYKLWARLIPVEMHGSGAGGSIVITVTPDEAKF